MILQCLYTEKGVFVDNFKTISGEYPDTNFLAPRENP